MVNPQPLFAELRPGEKHHATLLFRLPLGVRAAGLFLTHAKQLERALVPNRE